MNSTYLGDQNPPNTSELNLKCAGDRATIVHLVSSNRSGFIDNNSMRMNCKTQKLICPQEINKYAIATHGTDLQGHCARV